MDPDLITGVLVRGKGETEAHRHRVKMVEGYKRRSPFEDKGRDCRDAVTSPDLLGHQQLPEAEGILP